MNSAQDKTQCTTPSLSPVLLIGASAGTGKTHRLAMEFASAISGTTDMTAVAPDKILCTTFTNKAADELMARVRLFLMKAGDWRNAQLSQTGYVGTVNSVCGQLVNEYALQAGLSPLLKVLPTEHVPAFFSQSCAQVVQASSAEFDATAYRLGLTDWRSSVENIATLARANGISPESLKQSGVNSWTSLMTLLPPAEDTLAESMIDQSLADSIDAAVASMESQPDQTKKSAECLVSLKEKQSILKTGQLLPWSDWAQIAKLSPAVKSSPLVAAVKAHAGRHPSHPRLHRDLNRYITEVFFLASQAMIEYERSKRISGLIDFTDQEYLLLKLLANPDICRILQERIEIALIDEFQDTSPIQLAIFLKIASLVKRSVWVGDEKQAIYGFRGTDPALVEAVIKTVVPLSGGDREQLTKSYRARPQLVDFANQVFSKSFPSTGIPASQVRIDQCHRVSPDLRNGLDRQACALHLWWLKGGSLDDALSACCGSIVDMLQRPAFWKVQDPESNIERPLTGSDIAVVCRTNDRCSAVSEALTRVGLKVALDQDGLLESSECVFAFAALRYLVDKHDTLAAAEIIHLLASPTDHEPWLEKWIKEGIERIICATPALTSLDQARSRLSGLTPGESLELAISVANVVGIAERWGNRRQRLSNLDALRGLAKTYEELCQANRSAATPAGFVSYLYKQSSDGGKRPADSDKDAINVVTYHGAKGLEWPVVILMDLQGQTHATPFGITAESTVDSIDPVEPLAGRWIRLWPWPYGKHSQGVYLDEVSARTPEMVAAYRREQAERLRLLYVGVTRARDYLIFACRCREGGANQLELLRGEDGQKILEFPREEGLQQIRAGDSEFPFLVKVLEPPPNQAVTVPPENLATDEFISPSAISPTDFLPLLLTPSKQKQSVVEGNLIGPSVVHSIGSRLTLAGKPDMNILGDVMHRFLAADPKVDGASNDDRLALAVRLIERWNLPEIAPHTLLEAGDRLLSFIAKTYPDALIFREIPVSGRMGLQRVQGRIDLLLETAFGLIIIDHKTYPGRHETWAKRAFSHKQQLALYATLAARAGGHHIAALLVHMPIIGKIVEVT